LSYSLSPSQFLKQAIASSFKYGLDAQGNFIEPDELDYETGEPPVVAEQINNQETLGITTRIKDLLLIGGGTALTGYLVFHSKSTHPLHLLKFLVPIHAVMLYGVTSSYLATRRLALAFTATGVALSAGLTTAITYLLTPDTENHKVLFKSLGWFIENVVVKNAANSVTNSIAGTDVELSAPSDTAEGKLEIWIKTITSIGITAMSGLIGMGGVNIFRGLTAKRFY